MRSRKRRDSTVPASLIILLLVAAVPQAGCLRSSAPSSGQTSASTEETDAASGPFLSTADASAGAADISAAHADHPKLPHTPGQPLLLGATARDDGGVGSFGSFLDGFLGALSEDRTEDYIGHVRFPLPMVRFESSYVDPVTGDRRRRDYHERRSVSRGEFTPFIIHDPDAWSNSVYQLEDAFSAQDTKAIYRGNRMLTFAPVDGGWVLSDIGVCIQCGHPEVLLCARPGRQTAFPGPGSNGNEDFHAFFEVFYCATQSRRNSDHYPHLSRERTNPDDAALSRIQFPLRIRYAGDETRAAQDRLITEDRFHLTSLFRADGGSSPPVMTVDGDTARVGVHGMASDASGSALFSRIEGLWYLTGFGD